MKRQGFIKIFSLGSIACLFPIGKLKPATKEIIITEKDFRPVIKKCLRVEPAKSINKGSMRFNCIFDSNRAMRMIKQCLLRKGMPRHYLKYLKWDKNGK